MSTRPQIAYRFKTSSLVLAITLNVLLGSFAYAQDTFFAAGQNMTLASRESSGRSSYQTFTLTSTKQFVLRYTAKYGSACAVIPASNLQKFLSYGSYSYYVALIDVGSGYKYFTLGPGNYAVAIRNHATYNNVVSFELDYDQASVVRSLGLVRTFSFGKNTNVSTRFTQGFTTGGNPRNRYFLDGCNNGSLDTYVIPGSEVQNFLAGRQFRYLSGTHEVGGYAPGRIELKLSPGSSYALAFVNSAAPAKQLTYVFEQFSPTTKNNPQVAEKVSKKGAAVTISGDDLSEELNPGLDGNSIEEVATEGD